MKAYGSGVLGWKFWVRLQKLELKKEVLRKWNQKLPGLLEPHQAQIIKFRSYTDLEINRASETLLRHMKTLDDYTQIKSGKRIWIYLHNASTS